MQPNLALTYSSSSRNSWLGVGWNLDAGYIERSTKDGVPQYNSSDTLTFLFQGVSSDLVKIPDGTYRAEDEGLFLRFEDNGVGGWEVRDTSGTRYLFGQTTASQIESLGKTFRWCLDAVIDRNGNRMTFSYTKDQGQLYLSQLLYTAHDAGLAPSNQVDLILEDRPDVDVSYRSGYEVRTAKRLQAIETRATVAGTLQLASRAELTYTQSARTGRSLLSGFTQVGTDGTSSLPPTTFTYQSVAEPTFPIAGGTEVPNSGLMIGDVNGDGLSDLITLNPSFVWEVQLAQGSSFAPRETWLVGFAGNLGIPTLGDFNGDGLTDLATYNKGFWIFAHSTGSEFKSSPWPRYSFTGYYQKEVTPFTGDFNGDGNVDVGMFDEAEWTIALSTGTGFSEASEFHLTEWGVEPPHLSPGKQIVPLVGDFNGDGLTDIAYSFTPKGKIHIRLSTGTGWAPESIWITRFPSSVMTAADFNGDGLTDLAFYDASGTRQAVYVPSDGTRFVPSYIHIPASFTVNSLTTNYGLYIGDFNGDGILDPGVYHSGSGAYQVTRSQGDASDLLTGIANGLGGSTTIQYQPSTQCDNTCPIDQLPKLPFVIPLVKSVTADDGLGNAYTTTYAYTGGRYDTATKEFRGFSRVEVTDVEGNVSVTEFHQDVNNDQYDKGRPFRSEMRDAAGNLWTHAEQTWTTTSPHPGVHLVQLAQSETSTCDGDATCKTTRTRYVYDTFGNITTAHADGDVDVSGDERTATTEYAPNTLDWILNRPIRTAIYAGATASGSPASQRRFFYDGALDHTVSPVTGNLTKEEEWLFPNPSDPTDPAGIWLATRLTYDAVGNVTTVTDAAGRTTTNTYDPDAIYLTTITNALEEE